MSELILKICCGTWENASHDKRELSVCRELGADVLVMAKGVPGDRFKKDTVDGFDVLRFSTRPLGTRIPNSINRVIALFTWAGYARRLHPDVISGHDISGLFIGWLSGWFLPKARKPVLVYDSHEFELGRAKKRSRLQLWGIKQLEGFLIRRCAFSTMVNDVIADEVQRIYRLPQRPIVTRNMPSRWTVNPAVTAAMRAEYCRQLNVPGNTFFVMFHGWIMTERGIETLIRLTAKNPHICAIILGNGEAAYVDSIKQLAIDEGVAGRVLFLAAVPLPELWKYVGAADAGMIVFPSTYKNHYYLLPNKFFENMQSETPVICSNFPAMQPLVEQYGVGLTCDPESLDAINACVEKLRTDTAFYAQCKRNLKLAKEELCWEREKAALAQAYKKAFDMIERRKSGMMRT